MKVSTNELAAHLVQRVNAADAIRRSASAFGSRTALVDANEQVSFRTLNTQIDQLASDFQARGLMQGDFLIIVSANSIDVARVYFACARAGLVAVPLHPASTPAEIGHVLSETSARAVAVEPALLPKIVQAAQQGGSHYLYLMKDAGGIGPSGYQLSDTPTASSPTQPLAALWSRSVPPVEIWVPERDPVQCLYTSGSTGKPKGVLTSHVAVVFTTLSCAAHMRATEADVGLLNLPMNHVGGLNDSMLTYLTVGAKGIIMPTWDPVTAAALVECHGVTIGMMSGPMWRQLLDAAEKEGRSIASIRRCNVGMANLSPAEERRLRAACPAADIVMVSGQTEFTGYQEGQRPALQHSKPLAWGAPTLMNEVEIMDDDGRLLGPGQVGEIVYRGPQSMNGYLGDDALTSASFKHGWFHSGDLGYVDDEQIIWFVDRKKDLIKTGGENVSPQEVTTILLGHEHVAECAVVGLPHPRWIEAVTAFVCVRPGADVGEDDLRSHCRSVLAPFKVPKRIVFLDTLPRGATGKLMKQVLRENYRDIYQAEPGDDRR